MICVLVLSTRQRVRSQTPDRLVAMAGSNGDHEAIPRLLMNVSFYNGYKMKNFQKLDSPKYEEFNERRNVLISCIVEMDFKRLSYYGESKLQRARILERLVTCRPS